ncbi:tolB protein precursor, periplasmic protein involved in the tonb-independent uptake of group A colicins [hydrothermal vent metagenome]|uniref:TolB protein, periplasmic protein involved in the tonb-independent uptake of group A colicins n=1 Tax=hydrothermal vent metagenome TaxID=652676 RepID=A0A3B0UKA1_9ZZZZ
MNPFHHFLKIILYAICLMLLVACGTNEQTFTPSPTVIAEVELIETATSPTSTATAVPTETPTLTLTAVPTHTPTSLPTDTPSPTPYPPPSGLIAFHALTNGNREIYVMNADGSHLSQLTNDLGSDAFVTFSPDGSRLAFYSNRSGPGELYVMNLDGSRLIQLTNSLANEAYPDWSPDGEKLAFVLQQEDDNNEIYLLDLTSNDLTRLTDNPALDAIPRWSPDGTKIAFISDRFGSTDIFVMDADGGNLIRLTDDSSIDAVSSWSPDGTQIAFHSGRGDNFDIYVMDADGNNIQRITTHPAPDLYPAWSADGLYFAFTSLRDGNVFDVYVIQVNGQNPERLTHLSDNAEVVRWSPPLPTLTKPFPLPTLMPTSTPVPPTATVNAPSVTTLGCPIASNISYGYSRTNPIQVGGGPFGGGPSKERAVLDALSGPEGQSLTYERTGSLPEGDIILDEYRVTYEGLATPIFLYFDIYNDSPRFVPVGLSCSLSLP